MTNVYIGPDQQKKNSSEHVVPLKQKEVGTIKICDFEKSYTRIVFGLTGNLTQKIFAD